MDSYHFSKEHGYSLIEILIVFAIIAILTSIVVFSIANKQAQARDSQRISDLGSIEASLESFYSDKNEYPEIYVTYDTSRTNPTLATVSRDSFSDTHFLEPLWKQNYLKDKPSDPVNDNAEGNYFYQYFIKRADLASGVYSNVQSFGLLAQLEVLNQGENVYRYCEGNVMLDYYYALFSSRTYRLEFTHEEDAGTTCSTATCSVPSYCPQW